MFGGGMSTYIHTNNTKIVVDDIKVGVMGIGIGVGISTLANVENVILLLLKTLNHSINPFYIVDFSFLPCSPVSGLWSFFLGGK